MDQLDRDGYVLIKGVCDPIEGKECINDQKVVTRQIYCLYLFYSANSVFACMCGKQLKSVI